MEHAIYTVAENSSQPAPRSGIIYWLRGYLLLMTWELKSLRLVLPLAVVVQTMLGAGVVIGFGFVIGEVSPHQAIYLATGATVVSMITIGLALVPQLIAARKSAGVYDYLWSLPVPRTTSVAASLTVNSIIALPGMAMALLIAGWRFGFQLQVSPTVIPAVLLTLVSATSIGFALAHAIDPPMVTSLVTNVLIFVILLFSPISFPADRLPVWLSTLHQGLPFEHAANLVRAGLTGGAGDQTGSFAVLAAWAIASWLVTALVIGRRS
jgi:ABC-2 type transport system permease protein